MAWRRNAKSSLLPLYDQQWNKLHKEETGSCNHLLWLFVCFVYLPYLLFDFTQHQNLHHNKDHTLLQIRLAHRGNPQTQRAVVAENGARAIVLTTVAPCHQWQATEANIQRSQQRTFWQWHQWLHEPPSSIWLAGAGTSWPKNIRKHPSLHSVGVTGIATGVVTQSPLTQCCQVTPHM